MKWIVSTVVILLIGLIVFAPVPIPHFTNFTSVFDVDGQEVDVTIRVRFVHFKPLFFQYGKFEGFPVSIKIYDNSEKEEICDLKFDGYLTSVSEHTYMALVGESDRRTTDENGLRFVVSDFGGGLFGMILSTTWWWRFRKIYGILKRIRKDMKSQQNSTHIWHPRKI